MPTAADGGDDLIQHEPNNVGNATFALRSNGW
jgi:hypothetical protein